MTDDKELDVIWVLIVIYGILITIIFGILGFLVGAL